jgi:NADH-quinone oxidoreductase subunit C
MTPQLAIEQLKARFGDAIGAPAEFRGETTVRVAREKILEICHFLKKDGGFNMLTDLSGVDNYGEDPRFEVVYQLISLTDRSQLRLKISVSEDNLEVDSVVPVWKTADWHEREAFDMFGLRFRGHPNLKRILMWDGYPYFPLRKDFPLAGVPTELPETAIDAGTVETAPMLGGPFVGGSGSGSAIRREPRQYDTIAEQQDKLKTPAKKESV